jgi:ClpP class serine protease
MPSALRGIIRAVEVGLDPKDYELFHKISQEERTALVGDLGKRVSGTTHAFRQGTSGIIFVDGPIVPRASAFAEASGMVSVQALTADFIALEKDPRIKSIVLLFDSPGGAIVGISDFAALVKSSSKSTIAYVYGMCASAAYWIASACDHIFAVDTGLVGGIGIVGTYRIQKDDDDETTLEIVSSQTPNKRVNLQSEDAQALLQKNANDLADVFIGALAENLGLSVETITNDFGKGATVVALPALAAGMIHEIATFADVLGEFSGQVRRRTPDSTRVQSLIFDKKVFPKSSDATAWARDHDFRADKVDETENSWRLRQRDPGEFVRIRTKVMTTGVKALVGPLKRAPQATSIGHYAQHPGIVIEKPAPLDRTSGTCARTGDAKNHIDRYRKKIYAARYEQLRGRSQKPAIAGQQGDFVNMDPILADLMANDPAIANAIKALQADAFAKGEQAGEQKAKARVGAATPYLTEGAEYGAPVRKVAMQVLTGQLDPSVLMATVAAVDAVKEGTASGQAALETTAIGDIIPIEPKVGGTGPAADLGYMSDEEFEAEIKAVRTRQGMEV